MSALETLLNRAPQLADGMRSGPNHVMVRCPFHGGGQERTPSLSISTWKPVFFCHACKTAGHISMLMRHIGMSKNEIDILVPKRQDYEGRPVTVAAKILSGADPFRGTYILDEEILDAYRLMPTALRNAGFKPSTLRHFEVGYDTKYLRITYPLRTVYGELVGISGRTIVGADSRYKIYDRELIERKDFKVPKDYSMEEVKSAILWHAHVVRPLFFMDHHKDDALVITEGFKACMWVWQAGYQDTVALVGSFLSPTHAEIIARAVDRVVLFLDNNEAGKIGTKKAGRALLEKGVKVYVAQYPDEREQPDNLQPNEVIEAIHQAIPMKDWSKQNVIPENTRNLLRRTLLQRTS